MKGLEGIGPRPECPKIETLLPQERRSTYEAIIDLKAAYKDVEADVENIRQRIADTPDVSAYYQEQGSLLCPLKIGPESAGKMVRFSADPSSHREVKYREGWAQGMDIKGLVQAEAMSPDESTVVFDSLGGRQVSMLDPSDFSRMSPDAFEKALQTMETALDSRLGMIFRKDDIAYNPATGEFTFLKYIFDYSTEQDGMDAEFADFIEAVTSYDALTTSLPGLQHAFDAAAEAYLTRFGHDKGSVWYLLQHVRRQGLSWPDGEAIVRR